MEDIRGVGGPQRHLAAAADVRYLLMLCVLAGPQLCQMPVKTGKISVGTMVGTGWNTG